MQTDYATLRKKGSLDYIYFLTNPSFNKFCVLFFEGLTIDDFHPPANGSRGKARMNKAAAMEKSHVLWGASCLTNKLLQERWEARFLETAREKAKKVASLNYRLKTTSSGAYAEMGRIATMIKKEEERYARKINHITEKIEYWKKASPRFSFTLEAS